MSTTDIPKPAGRKPVSPLSADEQPLYVDRTEIYQQSIWGFFRQTKWIVLVATLAVYYLLPFVRWYRGPDRPDQAVLIDFPNSKFYFFFVEIWPQEFYVLTGLLILAAFTLFLMNAVAGRVWCGYLCPQTVWTDLFQAVERWIEGDRRERMKLHAQPFGFDRAWRLGAKHTIWILIAWWTGGAWVLYFADAPTLVWELLTFQAPQIAYIAIAVLTFTTYAFAGLMREQVCQYMCPWPRIQAAMTDQHAYNVTYIEGRGEPRMSLKQSQLARSAGQPAGDCVDCKQCVVVCPTGIDIRDGMQLGCIQCGLCIDACDGVMAKVGRPSGLVAYETQANIDARACGQPPVSKIIRPRTLLYVGLIAIVGLMILFSLGTRAFTTIASLHDRDPLYVRLADGGVRNAYTIRIVNKRPNGRIFTVSVEGFPRLQATAIGALPTQSEWPMIEVPADSTREVRLLVTAPPGAWRPGSTEIVVRAVELGTGEIATTRDNFIAPGG